MVLDTVVKFKAILIFFNLIFFQTLNTCGPSDNCISIMEIGTVISVREDNLYPLKLAREHYFKIRF